MKSIPSRVLIAGVGPGLGLALAKRFIHEGCTVGLLARNENYLNQLSSELSQNGQTAIALPADLTDPIQITSAFQHYKNTVGSVDVLINHAGLSFWQSTMEISAEDFEQTWRTSTLSALLCSQQVIPDMLSNNNGHIIFSGSTSAVRGRKGAIDFSSSQFARRGLADAMARELWPQGIHVAHIIIDGIIDTPRVRQNYVLAEDELLMCPDDIAESYWHLIQQPKSSWAFEIAIRPHTEAFFE